MRERYLVKRQRTAGAYQTIQVYYRKQDAIDFLTAQAALNPDYPYDGGDTYAYGPSKHNRTRFKIEKERLGNEPNVVIDSWKPKGLKRLDI